MQSSPLANRLPLSMKEDAALSARRGVTRAKVSQAYRDLLATVALTKKLPLALCLYLLDGGQFPVLGSRLYFDALHL